jgi:hypothetical protein
VALLAQMEEDGGFVKKYAAVVVWAWFLLAARHALRASIGSVISFSMPKSGKREKEALQHHFFGFVPVKDKRAIKQGLSPLLEGIIPCPTA